jgi:hypothetical protein
MSDLRARPAYQSAKECSLLGYWKGGAENGRIPAEIATAVRPAPATLKAIHCVLFGLGGICNKNIQKQG